jgi:hypothetical protein
MDTTESALQFATAEGFLRSVRLMRTECNCGRFYGSVAFTKPERFMLFDLGMPRRQVDYPTASTPMGALMDHRDCPDCETRMWDYRRPPFDSLAEVE